MDRVGSFLQERTPRRAIALGLFIGLLALFRSLLLLVVFFVVFERVLAFGAHVLALRLRIPRRAGLLVTALAVLSLVGAGAYFGITRGVHAALDARQNVPARIEQLKATALYKQLEEHLPDAEAIVERARHYTAGVFKALSAVGHGLAFALVGFILAVVFTIEEDELREFFRRVDPRSLRGTLMRWLGHVADAMLVTVQFQLVVALCNAVLTFPILLLVGIPHAPTLAVLIFVSGLVPVVGNFVMGAVLTLLAWQAKGWFGVVLFTVLTFVLHKLESYYLNPRLAARHVRLPSFLLIVSLVLWEQAAGLVGLFLSFPFLYVATRIREELKREDEAVAAKAA